MWNFISIKGDILYPNEWFASVHTFQKKYTEVQNKNGFWNLLTFDGRLLSPHLWFTYISEHIICRYDNYYYMDTNMRIHKRLLN